ncbi:MAG: carbohydrate ABC transporter permease, partial [Treponema sp.]|nr:carbohydrate ABC transporter permease [Treponema sp.]
MKKGIHYQYDGVRTAFTLILIGVFVIITMFPFYWLVTASVKLDEHIISRQFYLLPPEITWEHYNLVFTNASMGRHLFNTALVSIITVLLSLAAIIPASYALSVLRVKGRRLISRFILALQMLPGLLFTIPLYITLQRIHLIDTYWALIISYTTFTIPFCFLLLSSYFASLPMELFESAYLDGANSFYSLISIALPLTTPGIITTGTYSFLMGWNDFLYANTFTSSPEIRTLCVEVIRLIGIWGTHWGNLAAGATITVMPVIIIFLLANKYIISGLTSGAV